MDEFEDFKFLLGETIMLYQFMENDLKLIYAGMLKGSFYKNIEYVRSNFKGLGQIVMALEELDNSDSTPYFDQDTYFLLNKLSRQINYYCHQCCVDFAYAPDFTESIEFKDSYRKLIETNNTIKFVQSQTEAHRIKILDYYNRV